MNSSPLVSVVIPTYKRPATLARAIKSVLVQTYKNWNIVVVDDNEPGSEDRLKTEAHMSKYSNDERIIYLKHSSNQGGSVARNTGIRYSSGEYIALLDDDDEFHPSKIRYQVDKLSKLDHEWGGAYTNWRRFFKGNMISESKNRAEGNLLSGLLDMSIDLAGGSTILIRKKVFEELGGFDPVFKRHQDWEFLIRFFRKYKIACVQEPLANVFVESEINRSDPFVLEEAQHLLFVRFKDDIEGLRIDERNRIYTRQYYRLAQRFIENDEIAKGFYYFKKIPKKTVLQGLALLIIYFDKYFGIRNSAYWRSRSRRLCL
jgi:glycosyltransferase involved in cell wall biosynthesis